MRSYTILKFYCQSIFFIGSGNFWYEVDTIGNDKTIVYKICSFMLLSTYGLMTALEILAAVIGDFPKDEKSDSVTFAVSHTIVMIKILSVILNKELIKGMNQEMVKACEVHERPVLMEEKYRAIKRNVIAYFVTVYGSAACFVFEGLRKMRAGSHFITIITYYPSFDNNSSLATAIRISTTVVLMIMMVTMIVSVDSFAMVHLIMLKYKFITLRHYFEGLRKEFDASIMNGDSKQAVTNLYNGLVDGIKMHQELLRISKNIDRAFGTVMALQLCQSSGSAVSLLLQIALSNDLTFVASMKIIFFVIALFFILGLFLCNAGEITYQASLLSDCIFYCGWHASAMDTAPARRDPRRLVLRACAQAQRPPVMKAFKMLELTYATFLLVVRSTYSVFALLYAQNK